MTPSLRIATALCSALIGMAGAARAADAPAQAPDSIVIYFPSGSAAIPADGLPLLDRAARLYRQGNPFLMRVSGSADKTGQAAANLRLSERRANAVFRGLVARGIPAERFEIVAKGVTDPAVDGEPGTPEEKNRSATITWK